VTKLSVSALLALTSEMGEDLQFTKSVDTTSSSVQSKAPFTSPAAASFIAATIYANLAPSSKRHVKTTQRRLE
jgi:hypothetical protein